MLIITSLQGVEMEKIKTVWDNIELYWKKFDKKLALREGDTQKDIIEFEKRYNVIFPEELVYSLKRNYQNSRRGRKALTYPWFGSNIGIDLLSTNEIKKSYEFYKKYSNLEDTKLPNVSTVFIGDIYYDKVTKWRDKWIPIVHNDEIDIVLFIDLDRTSKNYQKVIGLYDTYLDGVGDHFRFALIANNYLEFISDLENNFFEYQKQNNNKMEVTDENGFDTYYLEKKFQLPKGFWTNEYREKMIEKRR